MTVFQTLSMWTLRALVAWGAFELGAELYTLATADLAAWTQINGHHAAMTRLEQREVSVEAAARAAAAPRTRASAMNAAGPRAAGDMLREHLIALGAQAAVVNSAGDAHAAELTARWREPMETSPRTLIGLAARFPNLEVRTLRLESQDGLIVAEALFHARLRNPEAAP